MKPAEEAMWQAISDGDLALIRYQWSVFDRPQDYYIKIDDYPSFKAVNPEDTSKSFFIHALESENKTAVAVVDFLLQNLPREALLVCDANNESPLLYAAAAGYTHVVEKLLSEGVAVDTVGASGRTALSYAADYDQEEVAACLLSRGAKPNQPDNEGIGPLHYGCGESNYKIVARLLAAGASPFYRTHDGRTVFDFFLEGENTIIDDANLIFLLLRYSAGINTKLPVMSKELSLTVVELIKESKDTIFMIGCTNAAVFRKSTAMFHYDNKTTINFSSQQQRKTLLEHCHYLLRQGALRENMRREIAEISALSQRLRVTDLQYMVADVLKQYDTKEKVKAFIAMNNNAQHVTKLSPEILTNPAFGLQLFGELLNELGYISLRQKVVTSELPVIIVEKERGKKRIELIERDDVIVTINRKLGPKAEMSNLDNNVNQTDYFKAEVAKHRDNWFWGSYNEEEVNCCREGCRLPTVIFLPSIFIIIPGLTVCAYYFHRTGDPTGLLVFGIIVLAVLIVMLPPMFSICVVPAKQRFHTISAPLAASRDELIEYLREIERTSPELPNLRNTLTAITAADNNRHGVLLAALENVKTFFNTEKLRIAQDPESQSGFRYYAAVTFYSTSNEKNNYQHKIDERTALLRLT